MRILCPNCNSKALITSTNQMSPTVRDMYCCCTNQKCSATFVATAAFKHYINPPASTIQQMAANLLNSLPKEERKALLNGELSNINRS